MAAWHLEQELCVTRWLRGVMVIGSGKRPVAYGGRFAADEADNDYADWQNATGQARVFTFPNAGRGMMEATLNVLEEFGSVPTSLRIAALRYQTGNLGALNSQVPAAVTAVMVETLRGVLPAAK